MITSEKTPDTPPQPAQGGETGSGGSGGAEGRGPETETQNRDSNAQAAPLPDARRARATRSSRHGQGLTRAEARKSQGRQKTACGAKAVEGAAAQAPRPSWRTSGSRYDWNEIRTRYIIGNESLREIAEKVHCAKSNIMTRSRKEGWPKLREEYRRDLDAKTVQKATTEAITERTRIARIAVGGMGAISMKWKHILKKMETTPPEEWEKDPEIAKLSPADYERLVKSYLLLMGEATERHEYKEQIAPETAEAIWRIMAEGQEREQGKGQNPDGI